MKKKGFTLLEIIFSLVVFGIIFGVLFTLFLRILRTKTDIEARQQLIKSTYDVVEQMNTKLQNYTIDYEEYFNRTMVGCTNISQQGSGFTWTLSGSSGYCPLRTAYGNQSPYFSTHLNHVTSYTQHKLYACSSDATLTSSQVYGTSGGSYPEERLLMPYNLGDLGCSDLLYSEYVAELPFALYGFRQPFGEYKTQFLDVKSDVDDVFGRTGDDDDTDGGLGPVAIRDNTKVKELYVISKDKRVRIMFRRALIATGDWNNNGSIDTDNERLYTIQMLQLKAFDAGQNHDFDALNYRGVYDGTTDTWACDFEAGFTCKGASLGTVFSGYRLPQDMNDGWINLLNSDVSVADWNLQIFPVKDPEYAWGESQYQLNPFIRLYLKTTVYGQNWANRIGVKNLDDVTFDIQTSFNIKSNY